MKFNIAPDARPQAKTLLIAAILSVTLWFIPFASYLIYPFKLPVTFIHEGGHALAAVLTNSAIFSLSVAPDTSGQVLAVPETWIASLLISSAGYLGATLFGALLLVLIRRAAETRIVLGGIAIYIALLTAIFGFALPIWNITKAEISIFDVTFTVASGFVLSAILLLIARFATVKTAAFFLSFLAVQCILNALFDLKTVLSYSLSPIHTDAVNMYNATGVPSIFWVVTWIAVSIVIVSVALRLYAVGRMRRNPQQDLPFED